MSTVKFRVALEEVLPVPDSTENAQMSDVIGNKEDVASRTADVSSIMAVLRKTLDEATEVEKHIHNVERWFGTASVVDPGVNEGENASLIPFDSAILTGETFGAWIPLLGSGDTPNQSGMTKFDMHRIEISDVVNDGNDPNKHIHFVQIAWGGSGAAGFAAGDYTEFITVPEKDGKAAPIDILMPRLDSGDLVFLRHRVVNRDTQVPIDECSMEFYVGLHEYTQ